MTKELREKLAALRAVAPELNATTQEVGSIVQAVEAMLSNDLSIGISVELRPFPRDDRDHLGEDGTTLRTCTTLGYGRVGDKFRILVVTETGSLDRDGDWAETIERTETPWSSCPRDIKLRYFERLPELLGAIADEAMRLNESARSTAGTVRDLLAAMTPEGISLANSGPPGPRPLEYLEDEKQAAPVARTAKRK
jgi:hypothetical protein